MTYPRLSDIPNRTQRSKTRERKEYKDRWFAVPQESREETIERRKEREARKAEIKRCQQIRQHRRAAMLHNPDTEQVIFS